MSVTIDLPQEAERTFRNAWGDHLGQKAFEALVIQGYREKILSVGRIAELMGLSTSLQAETWLAEHRVERNIDETDILHDFSVHRSGSALPIK